MFSKVGPDRSPAHALRAVIQIMNMKKNGVISDADWTTLMQMTSHLEDIKQRKDEFQTNFEVMTRGIFEILHLKAIFSADDIQQVYSRVNINSRLGLTNEFGLQNNRFYATR